MALDPSDVARRLAERRRTTEHAVPPPAAAGADVQPSVVRLPVVDVAELERPEQHFRCVPYAATIRAAACVERQRQIGARARGDVWFDHKGHARQRAVAAEHQYKSSRTVAAVGRWRANKCSDCELGRRVAERLGKRTEAVA